MATVKIVVALDSVSPCDRSPEGIAWAEGFARFLARHLDACEVDGGYHEHTVTVGDSSDYPSEVYREESNHAYNLYCGGAR